MARHLNSTQERILLELSGRGDRVRVSVRDLCESIGIDYDGFESAARDLYRGDMIAYHYNANDSNNPSYSITWIGEDWLAARPAPSVKPPRRGLFGFLRRKEPAA